MKYMGIDFGTVRVGVALSDEEGQMSFPKEVIKNDRNLIKRIKDICLENFVEAIVLGESRNFSGKKNLVMDKIEKFKEKLLEELDMPIYMYPEFLTSAEAVRLQGENDMLDASSASLILRHFLDTKKYNNLNS